MQRRTTTNLRTKPLSLETLELRMMLSISATIDYSYDTNNFFNTNAKKDLLQLAADNVVAYFQDDLSAISPSGGNNWSAAFFHPGTGSSASVYNLNVAADTVVIYAGGRNLGGSLGQGGPGGYSVSGSSSWITTVQTRGETGAGTTDFGPWGGSVTFNTTSNWHFGETTSGLSGSEFDFYSVALHELAHLFGFGTANSFDTFVNAGPDTFDGPEAVLQYDGTGDVPLSSSNGHWASGTTDGAQEAAMDPSISGGTRKELTLLDLAGLSDLGWEIDLSEAVQTKLIASDLAATDWFGHSVDIDGDYAVVGAPLDDDVFSKTGSAYIYYFDGVDWVEQAKITASTPSQTDEFGWSVAIAGDTVVVGTKFDGTEGFKAGAAYVFQRDHGGTNNWGQVTKITGTDTTAGDRFGFSVNIDGNTIVVGAELDDPLGRSSGAAYVFERDQGGTDNWGEIAKLIASDGAEKDRFGHSVNIDGNHVVVGSRLSDGTASNTGSAYVFRRNLGGTDNWGQIAKLTALDEAYQDQFGYSVAVAGTTIAVGARLDDDGGASTGSVYIYEKNQGGTNNWGHVTKISAVDATTGAYFGMSVAMDGDDIAIGAMRANSGGGSKVGAVYHHSRDQGGTNNWGQVEKLTADDASYNDRNGISVGISSSRIISGAYLEDPNGLSSAGSSYVYVIDPGGSGGSGSLVTEPANEPNHPEHRTVRKEPGGCGCGGHGCAICAPVNDQFTSPWSQRELSNSPLRAMLTPATIDTGIVDDVFVELSQDRLSLQRSLQRHLLTGGEDQESTNDWLAEDDAWLDGLL